MVLERKLPFGTAFFSYFPADRAMPAGEAGIQLGIPDATAQMHSHLAQPATKYARLKTLMVNQTLSGPAAQKALAESFEIIFERLLFGKRLKGLSISAQGPLSVLIEDTATKKVYDIDRMSSGEKGLILQFLIMRRSLARGGLVLLDEPELHLNPAICKRLVSFIVENVTQSVGAQALICTHSPEVLADAFDRPDCRLFHLRSSTDLSRVYKEDKEQIFEALRRLGATTSDVLFSKGNLFVEGPHDADILEDGFPSRVSGYRIKQLRGRGEIEKEIKTLQLAESDDKLNEPQFFVFDRDRLPSSLSSSELVRVHQWDRYCLENFLLEADAVFDVLKDNNSMTPPQSRAEANTLLKKFAINQISGVAAREIYSTFEPDNPGYRPAEMDSISSFNEIGTILHARLVQIQGQIAGLSEAQWVERFVQQCESKAEELRALWEEKWMIECNGKRVLSDVHKHTQPKCSLRELKRRLVVAMAARPTDNWRVIDSSLADLLLSQ